jgi:hypothetical protein
MGSGDGTRAALQRPSQRRIFCLPTGFDGGIYYFPALLSKSTKIADVACGYRYHCFAKRSNGNRGIAENGQDRLRVWFGSSLPR